MREKRRSMILSCQSACAAVTILIVSLASAVLRADEPRPAGHREGAIERPVVAFRVEDDLPGKAGGSDGDISIPQAKASLAGFEAFVDDARKKWQVPGQALVIIKDGEIVLERGFGYRDVKNKLPVTPHTLFAIGSCTKAFTTFVMGTLVDEGKMEWDTPLRTYIPELRMYDRMTTELIAPRDLVTHRTGLPRHDQLHWAYPALTRKQIVERLQYLEPSAPFRSKWQYNNIMYVTAGYLVERLTGKPWEDAVRARVFEPLGMTSSNLSVKESQKSADHAIPYADQDDKIVEIPFRDMSAIGPAGSINSCVADMARWVSVHTYKGIHAGRQIISPGVLADIHSPHMIDASQQQGKGIAPMGYGLGWWVQDYRGHRRVWHSGNIDGFSAMTTLFPQDGLGFVALSNMNGTQLPEMITRHAADRVLGLSSIDWSGEELSQRAKMKADVKEGMATQNSFRKSRTTPAHTLEDYAGEYENHGYGLLRVALREGKLSLHYGDFDAPLEHWHYEVFNAPNPKNLLWGNPKPQFQTSLKGDVASVAIDLEPSVKPIVFAKRPDSRMSDPEYLKRFVGEYAGSAGSWTFRLKGRTLVIDIPGAGTATLLPDQNEGFTFKEQPTTAIQFVTGNDGKVDEFALSAPEGAFNFKRKAK